MRTPKLLYAALLVSGVALADTPLDVTIRVLESPSDLPDAVTKRIELPRAPETRPEQVPPGHDRANDARGVEAGPLGRDGTGMRGTPPGLDRANQARPQGRDFDQSVADEARNRGDRGNGAGRGPHGRGRP